MRVLDDTEDDDPDGMTDRPRPLVAVDFGHAVWVEYLGHGTRQRLHCRGERGARGRGPEVPKIRHLPAV